MYIVFYKTNQLLKKTFGILYGIFQSSTNIQIHDHITIAKTSIKNKIFAKLNLIKSLMTSSAKVFKVMEVICWPSYYVMENVTFLVDRRVVYSSGINRSKMYGEQLVKYLYI